MGTFIIVLVVLLGLTALAFTSAEDEDDYDGFYP